MKVDVYSSFFSSGLRAITGRPRKRPSSMYTYPSPLGFTLPEPSSSSSSRPAPLPSTKNIAPPYVRSRRSSVLFTMSHHEPSSSRSTTPSRSRRSSLLSFPTRVLNRMSTSFHNEPHLPRKSTSRPHSSSGLRHEQTSEMPDVVWITEGGPIVSSPLTMDASPKLLPLDPFSSSPDSKSVFVDFTDTPISTPNRESFISFTTSSNRSSVVHLPRRERPTSIQTMPLPPRSRRSSLQYPLHNSQEKYDWAWMLDEATPIYSPRPAEELAQVEEADEVDPAQLDWWQFHNDFVQGDGDVSPLDR